MITEIKPGTLINKRYLINRTLGQGGFGRTYLATDTQRFDEQCVLKEFVPATTNAELILKSRELFEREAKVLYQIEHPHIPKFLAWVTDGERLFIVQEYINGKSYSQIIHERLTKERKPFSEVEVKEWLLKILPILDYIHNLNIIHRDISLDNIMLPQNQSQPVLIDFGVVKQKFTQLLSANPANNNFSLYGSVVGKFGYSPPEQLRLGKCYPSSDIYALAVCAIVLLSGRMPQFLIDDSLEWKWQSYVKISTSFANTLNKMLAEVPTERYQSAQELILELNVTPSKVTPGKVTNSKVTISEPRPIQLFESQSQNQAPTKLDSQAPVSFNTKYLDYVQQELTSFIGPFASVLIKQALAKSPHITAEELLDSVSAEIPNRIRAHEFRNRVKLPEKTDIEKLQNSFHSQSAVDCPAISNPEFLNNCRRELTSFIGPIASVLVEKALAKHPHSSPNQLIETLVSEIPNQERAQKFKERIYKLKVTS
ncbi:Serine/Threonine protein kinase [Rivularia sp. IAM M-261]|nr:Serine/Threonine protein kinase [Calothrix sp. PCC 7716]GJD17677.1 Serine/Threonine protein kinase [Rivularia sp. IAM M-261]